MVVIGAILTPPDPFTQLMMAGPMAGLYGIGLVLSRVAYRRRQDAATALSEAVKETQ